MGALGRNGRWPAFGLSATLAVGGVALMSRPPSLGAFWIGCGLLGGGLVMFLVTFTAGLFMDSKRRAACEALDALIGAGNIVWRDRNDGHDPTAAGVEAWRATLDRLQKPPFTSNALQAVAVKWGDRITEPLARLIEVRAHVDDYIK